jgi:carboxymethylenebutenolidase
MTNPVPDQKIISLFDSFTHGGMSRREFMDRLTAMAGSSMAAAALLPVLENNYAQAGVLPENDPRITATTLTSDKASGYLVTPRQGGPFPGVLVIHENRGLNPHIRDVTRRMALEGFAAYAPDYLSPLNRQIKDEDEARDVIGKLDPAMVLAVSQASLATLKANAASTGKAGAVGFCWGGGQVNRLAAADPGLSAGVAYYGMQVQAADVAAIKAPLLLHYAGLDDRINAGIADFEKALKAGGKTYDLYLYPGVNHAFNNDTNAARYDKVAADLAWGRTVAFLRKYVV